MGSIAENTKHLHGIWTGSPMVITLGRQYNVGEKPTVILYTYINRHAGTPTKGKTNQYIRSQLGSSNDAIKRRVQRETICLQTDQSKVKGSFNGLLDWVTICFLLGMIENRKFWIDKRIELNLYTYKQTFLCASNFSPQCSSVQSASCCLMTVQITTVVTRKYSVLL